MHMNHGSDLAEFLKKLISPAVFRRTRGRQSRRAQVALQVTELERRETPAVTPLTPQGLAEVPAPVAQIQPLASGEFSIEQAAIPSSANSLQAPGVSAASAPTIPNWPAASAGPGITFGANRHTPILHGFAEAGRRIDVFDGSTSLGSVTADSTGAWTFSIVNALADGSHSITAKAVDTTTGAASSKSAALLLKLAGGAATATYADSSGKTVIVTIDAPGNTRLIAYDAQGHYAGEDKTYADGSHYRRVVNANGSSNDTWTDANGNVTASASLNFNADGTSTYQYQDNKGVTRTISYDAQGRYAGEDMGNADGSHYRRVVNADGSANDTWTDAQGNVTASATLTPNPDGTLTYQYRDSKGNTRTIYYDAQSNVTSEYDRVFNADGSNTEIWLDSLGNTTATFTHNANGTSAYKYRDSQGNTRIVYYDAQNHYAGEDLTYVNGSHYRRVVNANGSANDTWTDAQGNVTATGALTRNTDGTSLYKYSNNQGLSRTINYDAHNQVISEYDHQVNANGTYTDTWLDGHGVITSTAKLTRNADGTSTYQYNDIKGNIYTVYYDIHNNVTSSYARVINANGSANDTWRDSQGTITATATLTRTAAGGSLYQYHDSQGNTRTINYDAQGRYVSEEKFSVIDSSVYRRVVNPDGSFTDTYLDARGVVVGTATQTRNNNGTYNYSLQSTRGQSESITLDTTGNLVGTWQYNTPGFTGMNLSDPRLVALRNFELPAIYAAYGLTANSSELARADAIRDWIARIAVYPTVTPTLSAHPTGSTSNVGVLPNGKTWADVNQFLVNPQRKVDDFYYWKKFSYDGYAMLDALLGVMNPNTGVRDNSGMMTEIAPGRYQIKDLATYHLIECGSQTRLLQTMYAAAGFQSMMILPPNHATTAVYLPSLQKWVYEDATFDEHEVIGSNTTPASPLELLQASQAGGASFQAIHGVKQVGPSWDPTVYTGSWKFTYFDTSVPPAMKFLMACELSDILGGIPFFKTVVISGSSAPDPVLSGVRGVDPPNLYPVVDGASVFAPLS